MKVWNKDGLSFSTISGIVDGDPKILRRLSIEVIAHNEEMEKELHKAKKALELAQRNYDYAQSQIGNIITYSQKKFNLSELVFTNRSKVYRISKDSYSVTNLNL